MCLCRGIYRGAYVEMYMGSYVECVGVCDTCFFWVKFFFNTDF